MTVRFVKLPYQIVCFFMIFLRPELHVILSDKCDTGMIFYVDTIEVILSDWRDTCRNGCTSEKVAWVDLYLHDPTVRVFIQANKIYFGGSQICSSGDFRKIHSDGCGHLNFFVQ